MNRTASCLVALAFAGCATVDRPEGNIAGYCNPDNAVRLGSQGRAYLGGCPRDAEGAFLAGLQRGRALQPVPAQAWPYLVRMETLERQLVGAASDAERETLRERLREAEFWAILLLNTPGTAEGMS